MKILLQESTDPYFNIATEEHLLKNYNEEYVILYRNNPSVIVGKHQNTMAEVNHKFIKENGIQVIRRISGGGAVYHDLGNVNFSFIHNGETGNLINFQKYTSPVIDFLKSLSLDATLGPKNEISINGLKVSGNAEHVYKNRVLHHGTLLYETNLYNLEQSLKSNENNYNDKAVRSNRSKTENIKELLSNKLSCEAFTSLLANHLMEWYGITSNHKLNQNDVKAINELIESKYKKFEWNYGYNSNYEYITKINGNPVKIIIQDGIISEIQLNNSEINNSSLKKIFAYLIGKEHTLESVEKILSDFQINGLKSENLI
ncbi:MAG: lipoate---protein ligase [Tenuifilum sp.]|jgi:lipoate-protein ligase A|uniref:lipoate--protein ligase family protein n=1 Tax=Tenuifilum sp. TaxID=2760880 RepID=UPI0024AB393E|nr:lipoate--protein ligase family protein [Tenuifilum sp.]MDI3526558.1 lipoate---protein ligase [Tenuifilum sp.]